MRSLQSLLDVLRLHDDGDDLIDWELEDWVSAGNPCRLRGATKDSRRLDLTAADLWCVDLFPSIEARLV